MQLPTPLLRNKRNVHKNDFGHVLILAGSPTMLGAAALSGLAAMRSGAGLVTIATAKSLNLTLQKKISSVIMTWPLPEAAQQTIAFSAAAKVLKKIEKFSVIALGPGLAQYKSTQNFICEIIKRSTKALVIDADALNAISKDISILKQTKTIKILTPHTGEMARLTGQSKNFIENNRQKVAVEFAHKHNCVLVLKGNHTIIANPQGKIYINSTGNAGMATAGSGDVLTGIISAFIGQEIDAFLSAKLAVYLHGKAGDWAIKTTPRVSVLATDLIDAIPAALRSLRAK